MSEEATMNATGGEYAEAVEVAQRKFDLDMDKAVEVQTDKARIKVVPCTGCKRPLVVSAFYVPSLAACAECRGEAGDDTVRAPIPGSTNPAKVEDLTKVLVNPQFARALCPVHPDNEEHEMELKSVSHSPHHGPSEIIGYKNGLPEFRQLAIGESVIHQCLKCRATVAYSTTAQVQFTRQNEPREGGLGVNKMLEWLDAREERPV